MRASFCAIYQALCLLPSPFAPPLQPLVPNPEAFPGVLSTSPAGFLQIIHREVVALPDFRILDHFIYFDGSG